MGVRSSVGMLLSLPVLDMECKALITFMSRLLGIIQ